ncbi:MAG: protein-disulfide reductase DsbD family protein, partial [Xanthomonadales bacterium]|nr:protein-disulfide reductase DsbD family protein [Xanthomonadales bacterium]
MKRHSSLKTTIATLCAWLCLWPVWASAVSFDEILEYDEAFRVSATALDERSIEVRWDIAPEHYLYHNKFLRFETTTPGVTLGEPLIPAGKKEFDALLGEEVIKFHGRIAVTLPLSSVPPGTASVDLEIQSQGCLENVLCYPPTVQRVSVDLPADAGIARSSLASVFGDGNSVPAASLIRPDEKEPALQPDDAFRFEAIALSAETALVRFTAQEGYYLYVDKFAFRVI